MPGKEKYYDRRRNERRHNRSTDPVLEIPLSDHKKRHGDRRCDPRRRNVRLNHSFEVSLPDQDGKTINVSASGVYFEVVTDDTDLFSPGTTIPIKITAVNVAPDMDERELKFDGIGTVVRNSVVENPDHNKCLHVALEFTENLNISL